MNEKPKLTEEQIKKIKSAVDKDSPNNGILDELKLLRGLSREEFQRKSKQLTKKLMNSDAFQSQLNEIKAEAEKKDKSILDDDEITRNK